MKNIRQKTQFQVKPQNNTKPKGKTNEKQKRNFQNDRSEKAKSDKEKTIVIKYPRNTEYQEEYLKVTQDIISQIDTIKNNVRIK